jgi:hypothetical protein
MVCQPLGVNVVRRFAFANDFMTCSRSGATRQRNTLRAREKAPIAQSLFQTSQ